MTSIVVTDLTGEYKGKLEGHLKADDFFGVAKHKKAKLKIKDVQFGKGGHYDVFAELTIKGITKPISFKADVTNSDKAATAKAKIVFNRTDFGIKYKSGKFFKSLGDKLIYDEVELLVKLVASK